MDGAVVTTTWDLAFRLRHQTPGTTHTFAIRARDASGNLSAASNPMTVTLEQSSDRTPPSTPTNLLASQPADDFCGTNMLQWTASTDNVDPQSAIEYEIYQSGSLRAVTAPGATWAAPYTLAGTNTWTVVAVDRAGNSSGASNPATLTVQADPDLAEPNPRSSRRIPAADHGPAPIGGFRRVHPTGAPPIDPGPRRQQGFIHDHRWIEAERSEQSLAACGTYH